MSDSTGIFQHASFTVPNFAEGYCTDDNARALVLAVMLQKLGHGSPPIHLAVRHLRGLPEPCFRSGAAGGSATS